MIVDRDEQPHHPPHPSPPRWQENFFVIANSDDGAATFLVHCKRWPATGDQVARIAVATSDAVVSRRVREPIPPDAFRIDGLTLEVVEPFRSLRLRGSFRGALGFGALGFIALAGDGPVVADVDLHLTSNLPPADFTAAFAHLAASFATPDGDAPVFEATQEHYEQGGRCTGTVTIDDRTRPLDGLFVRDHTWGLRDESAMSAAGHGFWTATALDGGELFFNATGMVAADGVHGIGIVVDADGQHTTSDIEVMFEPTGGLRTFNRTRVRIGGERPISVAGTGDLHLVKYLPGSGPRRFDDNLIARVTGGGLSGFGVHEYAGTLTPEQAEIVENAERDANGVNA